MTAVPRSLRADAQTPLVQPLHHPDHAINVTPDVSETRDAPYSVSTPYRIAVDQTFGGTITAGDADTVAVNLVAGQTYRFLMTGNGGNPLPDTILELRDPNGNLVAENDDTGQVDVSYFEYRATTSGTYYLGMAGYRDSAGDYVVTVAPGTGPEEPPPTGDNTRVWTMEEIAGYLTDGYYGENGEQRRSFAVEPGDTLTCDLSGLTAHQQMLARTALNVWSQVTGIQFDTSSRAGAGANIHFTNTDNQGAYSAPTSMSGQTVYNAIVNVPVNWAGNPANGLNDYAYQTFIHEIGHALGLGHAGRYNGGRPTYGTDNVFANDSWQASVMSYLSQADNPEVDATLAYVMTPMMADIIAIQNLYGTRGGLFSGANTWGVNGNVGGAFGSAMALVSRGVPVTMTIFDQGGIDTLDVRNGTSAQRINLAPGSISDIYGKYGNLSIERTTLIENAIAGSGNDRVTGNAAANMLHGMAGNDILSGLAGNDLLIGGPGQDQLIGGAGNDTYMTDGADTIVETANGGYDTVQTTANLVMAAQLEAAVATGAAALSIRGNVHDNAITGNAAANQLLGGAGNDVIRGGAGNDMVAGEVGNDVLLGEAGRDTLAGGIGNDVYVWDGQDAVIEQANAGYDIVRTGSHMRMQANVEVAQVVGAAVTNIAGNELANTISGNDAANQLSGGGGNDTLTGGGGNDILVGDAGNDLLAGHAGRDTMVGGAGNDVFIFDGLDAIGEAANGGTDTVQTWSHYALPANVEILQAMGANAINLAGNDLANTLIGNAGANQIAGGAGDDALFAGAGNDLLVGGAGNDRLVAGQGADVLQGGVGADMFVFNTANHCRVQDFQDNVDTLTIQRLGGLAGATLADILGHATDTAQGLRFTFGAATIILTGATIANIQDDLLLA